MTLTVGAPYCLLMEANHFVVLTKVIVYAGISFLGVEVC